MFPPHLEWLCWEAIYTKLLCERKLYVFRITISIYEKVTGYGIDLCIIHVYLISSLIGGYNCQCSLKESSKIAVASTRAGTLFKSSRVKELYLQQTADESWYCFCEPNCPSPVITDPHPTLSVPKLSKLGTIDLFKHFDMGSHTLSSCRQWISTDDPCMEERWERY